MASRANGLTGFFKSPSTPTYQGHIEGDKLFDKWLVPPDPDYPDFVPRPADHFEFPEDTQGLLEELGFRFEKTNSSPGNEFAFPVGGNSPRSASAIEDNQGCAPAETELATPKPPATTPPSLGWSEVDTGLPCQGHEHLIEEHLATPKPPLLLTFSRLMNHHIVDHVYDSRKIFGFRYQRRGSIATQRSISQAFLADIG